VVDVRLPDGTRLSAVFPPASLTGVVASFRKPVMREQTLGDLVPPGARDLQTLLESAVAAQRNLLLTGDPPALAALVAALAAAIPGDRRVVSIGATAPRPRAGWTDLASTADMPALVRVAVAFHPEHLLAAEAAGPEALELLLAAARGQEGVALALPARTADEAVARLQAVVMAGLGAGSAAAAPLIGSTIDLVVQVVATASGGARVVEVAEPAVEGGHVTAATAAIWLGDDGRRGGAGGRLEMPGVSPHLGAALAAAGHALPAALVRR
jgi:pilus assembly protein CpaF